MANASPPFNARLETRQDVVAVMVVGELDAYSAPLLTEAVDEARREVDSGTFDCGEVDLTETTLIDSAGINAILASSKHFTHFSVRAPHPWQRRLFEIVGLQSLIADDHDRGAETARGESPPLG